MGYCKEKKCKDCPDINGINGKKTKTKQQQH